MGRREILPSGPQLASRFARPSELENLSFRVTGFEEPLGGIYLRDTFSGEAAGTNLTAHTGETGASWTMNPNAAWANPILIDSGARAYASLNNAISSYTASGVPISPAQRVSGSFHFFGGDNSSLYLGARVIAASMTGVFGGWKSTAPGPRWELWSVAGGAFTLIAAQPEAHPGAGATVPVVLTVAGGRARLSRSGVEILNAAYSTINVTGRNAILQINYLGGWAGPGNAAGIHLTDILGRDV